MIFTSSSVIFLFGLFSPTKLLIPPSKTLPAFVASNLSVQYLSRAGNSSTEHSSKIS